MFEETVKLSPSTLNLLNECPRCFWLQVNRGVGRPRGPMPSIAIGLDSAITRYFHYYRRRGELPPVLRGKVDGRLADREIFDLRSGVKARWLVHEARSLSVRTARGALPVVLLGKLDDCIVEPGGCSPLDYKTRASLPEDVHPSYKLQMDVYTFLLRENKMQKLPVTNRAYLLYFCPRMVRETDFGESLDFGKAIPFETGLKPMETEPDGIPALMAEAVRILSLETEPAASDRCEYCGWTSQTAPGPDTPCPGHSTAREAAPAPQPAPGRPPEPAPPTAPLRPAAVEPADEPFEKGSLF